MKMKFYTVMYVPRMRSPQSPPRFVEMRVVQASDLNEAVEFIVSVQGEIEVMYIKETEEF